MKKVLVACAAIALIAGFTSCNKNCKCKTYAAGVVVKEYEQEIDEGMKCCDYTEIFTDEDGGLKTGVECK